MNIGHALMHALKTEKIRDLMHLTVRLFLGRPEVERSGIEMPDRSPKLPTGSQSGRKVDGPYPT